MIGDAAIEELPDVEAELRRDLGIVAGESDEGLTRSTMRPALNVVGLHVEEGGWAIPATAVVHFDLHLVTDQTIKGARDALESWLTARGWSLTDAPTASTILPALKRVRLEWGEGYPGYRADMTSPAAKAVINAVERAAGEPIAILPMLRGSVPIYLLDEVLKVPIIGVPIANHDNNQHSTNQNIRLQNLWDGIETWAALLADLRW